MVDTPAIQCLKALLAELPAEFSLEPPGTSEPRESFRVIKKTNVRRVHEALWELQVHFGLQQDRKPPKVEVEAPVVAPPVDQADPGPLLVSQEEAARLLGVERTTIWRMVKRRDLTSVSIGSRRLISTASIEAYIATSAWPAKRDT